MPSISHQAHPQIQMNVCQTGSITNGASTNIATWSAESPWYVALTPRKDDEEITGDQTALCYEVRDPKVFNEFFSTDDEHLAVDAGMWIQPESEGVFSIPITLNLVGEIINPEEGNDGYVTFDPSDSRHEPTYLLRSTNLARNVPPMKTNEGQTYFFSDPHKGSGLTSVMWKIPSDIQSPAYPLRFDKYTYSTPPVEHIFSKDGAEALAVQGRLYYRRGPAQTTNVTATE